MSQKLKTQPKVDISDKDGGIAKVLRRAVRRKTIGECPKLSVSKAIYRYRRMVLKNYDYP